jgi:hypothetical protein
VVVIYPALEELIYRFLPDKLLRELGHLASFQKSRETVETAESENDSIPTRRDNRNKILYFISTFLFAVAHADNYYSRKDGFIDSIVRGEIDYDSLEQRLKECLSHCIEIYELARLVFHPVYLHSSVWASFGAHLCWNFAAHCISLVGSYYLQMDSKNIIYT